MPAGAGVTVTKVKLNSGGMAALLKSDEVRQALTPVADRVADAARAGAPVRTGAYRDSIHVESDTTDRAVERVVADVSYARDVEARTGNLARALSTAGR